MSPISFLSSTSVSNIDVTNYFQISLCNTRQFGSCRANNPSCPEPPPDLPATGVAERSRFFKPGYRGLGEPHMLPEKEMQPYGGYVDIQKTAASGQETFIQYKLLIALQRHQVSK